MTARELERANVCFACYGPLRSPKNGHYHSTSFPTRDVCCKCVNCKEAVKLKLGITGTRKGLTDEQRDRLGKFYLRFQPSELHHGDCVGADEEADGLAHSMYINTVIHPPEDDSLRAECEGYKEIRDPLPFIERNKAIVNSTDVLVALPAELKEVQRSGTWSTVRYARKLGRPIAIIYPDGKVKAEGKWPR